MKTFEDALKNVRGLSSPSLDGEMSCGRDLRSIAEMMNNFHHERLRAAWKMIYG